MTNGDDAPKMPPRNDVMVTSVYQAAPEQDQVNGSKVAVPEEAKPVPGTSLRCLEDPQFSFDGGINAVAPLPKPRKPTYKVRYGWVPSISMITHVQQITLSPTPSFLCITLGPGGPIRGGGWRTCSSSGSGRPDVGVRV